MITHDLGVVSNIADKIAVMYAGKVVEYGNAEDIFEYASHPYTWAVSYTHLVWNTYANKVTSLRTTFFGEKT